MALLYVELYRWSYCCWTLDSAQTVADLGNPTLLNGTWEKDTMMGQCQVIKNPALWTWVK